MPEQFKPETETLDANLPSDAALVSRLVLRDEAALAELYDRYSGALYGLALRISGSSGLAEEVVQDTMMKLWRNPQHFDPHKARLSTYLIALVRNAAIDGLRRARPTQALEDELGVPLPIPSQDPGPLEQAELHQEALRVRAALGGLSAAHRTVVELAYFAGKSREEIAAQTGVPVGTVKSRLKYALDKLREALGGVA